MDRHHDLDSCADCGHTHLPFGSSRLRSRRDQCWEEDCDCKTYTLPIDDLVRLRGGPVRSRLVGKVDRDV